jgi:hypothetical protein
MGTTEVANPSAARGALCWSLRSTARRAVLSDPSSHAGSEPPPDSSSRKGGAELLLAATLPPRCGAPAVNLGSRLRLLLHAPLPGSGDDEARAMASWSTGGRARRDDLWWGGQSRRDDGPGCSSTFRSGPTSASPSNNEGCGRRSDEGCGRRSFVKSSRERPWECCGHRRQMRRYRRPPRTEQMGSGVLPLTEDEQRQPPYPA